MSFTFWACTFHPLGLASLCVMTYFSIYLLGFVCLAYGTSLVMLLFYVQLQAFACSPLDNRPQRPTCISQPIQLYDLYKIIIIINIYIYIYCCLAYNVLNTFINEVMLMCASFTNVHHKKMGLVHLFRHKDSILVPLPYDTATWNKPKNRANRPKNRVTLFYRIFSIIQGLTELPCHKNFNRDRELIPSEKGKSYKPSAAAPA